MKADPEYDLVVIASSAGGINALGQVLSRLPADFPLPISWYSTGLSIYQICFPRY